MIEFAGGDSLLSGLRRADWSSLPATLNLKVTRNLREKASATFTIFSNIVETVARGCSIVRRVPAASNTKNMETETIQNFAAPSAHKIIQLLLLA